MGTKRQHTERAMKIAFWRPHITGFHTSNMTAKAYCQKHGLVLHQLKYWQYEIEKETGTELSAPSLTDFVEITSTVQPAKSSKLNKGIEIKTCHGFSIIIHAALSEEDLRTVLSTIKDLS